MKKIRVPATKEQIKRARTKADRLGELNNSIRKGEGNFVGYLGQIVVADHFGWSEPDTYDFDVVALDNSRLDVKAKKRSVPCKPDYEFSVAQYNIQQDCRGYIPVSAYLDHRNRLLIEIMGWIPKDQFLMMAQFMPEGTVQPNMKRGKIRAACFNLTYDKLIPIAPPLIAWSDQ